MMLPHLLHQFCHHFHHSPHQPQNCGFTSHSRWDAPLFRYIFHKTEIFIFAHFFQISISFFMTYRQPRNFWHLNFQLGAGVESKLPPSWGGKSPVWIDTQKCANVKDELVELILLSPLPKVFKWFPHLLTSFSSIYALSLAMS